MTRILHRIEPEHGQMPERGTLVVTLCCRPFNFRKAPEFPELPWENCEECLANRSQPPRMTLLLLETVE